MKKKYYVVWQGRREGIYDSWEECLENVRGYPNAKYKSFGTLEEAQLAFEKGADLFLNPVKIFSEGESPIIPSICVDAACNVKTKVMEYRGVDTLTKEQIFRQGPFEQASNNIGEFLAIVHAAALLKKQNKIMPIYSDSNVAIKWVKEKRINTTIESGDKVQELINRALIWLKDNTYPLQILKWDKNKWGENPADFGRK